MKGGGVKQIKHIEFSNEMLQYQFQILLLDAYGLRNST